MTDENNPSNRVPRRMRRFYRKKKTNDTPENPRAIPPHPDSENSPSFEEETRGHVHERMHFSPARENNSPDDEQEPWEKVPQKRVHEQIEKKNESDSGKPSLFSRILTHLEKKPVSKIDHTLGLQPKAAFEERLPRSAEKIITQSPHERASHITRETSPAPPEVDDTLSALKELTHESLSPRERREQRLHEHQTQKQPLEKNSKESSKKNPATNSSKKNTIEKSSASGFHLSTGLKSTKTPVSVEEKGVKQEPKETPQIVEMPENLSPRERAEWRRRQREGENSPRENNTKANSSGKQNNSMQGDSSQLISGDSSNDTTPAHIRRRMGRRTDNETNTTAPPGDKDPYSDSSNRGFSTKTTPAEDDFDIKSLLDGDSQKKKKKTPSKIDPDEDWDDDEIAPLE